MSLKMAKSVTITLKKTPGVFLFFWVTESPSILEVWQSYMSCLEIKLVRGHHLTLVSSSLFIFYTSLYMVVHCVQPGASGAH